MPKSTLVATIMDSEWQEQSQQQRRQIAGLVVAQRFTNGHEVGGVEESRTKCSPTGVPRSSLQQSQRELQRKEQEEEEQEQWLQQQRLQQHPNEESDGASSSISWSDVVSWILALAGLYWFAASFFLAKRSLSQQSACGEGAILLREVLGLSENEIAVLLQQQPQQQQDMLLQSADRLIRQGCWLPRTVDSALILVVDALRFDFARYNLPESVGKRLVVLDETDAVISTQLTNSNTSSSSTSSSTNSRLFQFVADPPTVTMQRLKALTTGGLPTFSDISANFGGATVEEDTWIQQLKNSNNYASRGLLHPTRAGFVGDDTWVDLFPTAFEESFPYPSFNTRDLDTVDNGCLQHIPEMLQKILVRNDASSAEEDSSLEVLVVHFLGVDHVGHTYGPHNEHMDAKLKQMDQALATVLNTFDSHKTSCHAAFIFGDHGMTADGNHGGGSEEETNAALFVHFSPGCTATNTAEIGISKRQQQEQQRYLHMEHFMLNNPRRKRDENENSIHHLAVEEQMAAEYFASIHQIDLVPTLSLLLGLPIPFANLGSMVPSLFPPAEKAMSASFMSTALALNAAQVWRYFTVYSQTANALTDLPALQQQLDVAVNRYKEGIVMLRQIQQVEAENLPEEESLQRQQQQHADELFYQAAALFKIFLTAALELGQRVWTRFDTVGMILGTTVLGLGGLIGYALPLLASSTRLLLLSWKPDTFSTTAALMEEKHKDDNNKDHGKHFCELQSLLPASQYWEFAAALLFCTFQCAALTFSNSYILEEEHVVMYSLAVLTFLVTLRFEKEQRRRTAMQASWISRCYQSPGVMLLLLPVASRVSELYVSGHGLDPSIRLHTAHSSVVFVASLLLLALFRWFAVYPYQQRHQSLEARGRTMEEFKSHASIDCITLFFLTASWLEKRSPNTELDGFLWCRIAMILLVGSLFYAGYQTLAVPNSMATADSKVLPHRGSNTSCIEGDIITILSKVLIGIMAVTGPSTAASLVLYTVQVVIVYTLARTTGLLHVHPMVLAALLRLVTRHVFFATNHGCAFNRLQYSAAFIATNEFYFVTGGISLFLNTFGWEMVGLVVCWLLSQQPGKRSVWRVYGTLQLLEALASCISVSVLRRHLMVWDIYAPHFLFVAIFTVLHGLSHLTLYVLSRL